MIELQKLEKLVGTPYSLVDCWALVSKAYALRGVELPSDYSQMLGRFRVVSEPEPWDLIPMHLASPLVPNHVAIVLHGGRFIHSIEGFGVTINDLSDPEWVVRFAKRSNGYRGFLRLKE